jgi:hypothetical protein
MNKAKCKDCGYHDMQTNAGDPNGVLSLKKHYCTRKYKFMTHDEYNKTPDWCPKNIENNIIDNLGSK